LGPAAVILLAGTLAIEAQDAPGVAESQPPDKSRYNLFHPTPTEFMREMNPDRPDKTECPYTVDAGHFQVEMDFANFTCDKTGGVTTRAWNVAPFNLKVGLLNNADLQCVFDSYRHVRTKDPAMGATTTQSGVGDFTTRMKVNLWGDDGGRTAFGVLPFVKLPTSTDHLGNDAVEGGIILPLAVELPRGFDMGLMTEVDFRRNDADPGRHTAFVNSVTFGHDLVGHLGGYAEFFSEVSTEHGSTWIGTLDFGLTYRLAKNVQLDAGVSIGITRAADDMNVFTGITVRL
jgi:hypothetical protein